MPKEEMSDEDLLSVTVMSDWSDFVAKMRKDNPKMSLKEIAKAFKERSKEDEKMAALSDEELTKNIEKMTNILKSRKKEPYPEEKDKEKAKEEMAEIGKKIQEMSQKIEEIDKKLNEPEAKSVQELSAGPKCTHSVYGADSENYPAGTLAMAEFLKSNYLK